MNLAQSTRMVLEELGLISENGTPTKPLPWRQSLGLNRREEDVRPIFWKNRNKSYIARTQDWDEFPNGRWGDSRSPAFGELDAYGIGLKGTNEQNIKLWGSPATVRDVANIFIRYLEDDIKSLPWSESPISSEADSIKPQLLDLNKRGLLTITSQPSVNGAKSTHPIHGWGPSGGYVYQKAYLELLIAPELITELIHRIDQDPNMTFYAVNKEGDHNRRNDQLPRVERRSLPPRIRLGQVSQPWKPQPPTHRRHDGKLVSGEHRPQRLPLHPRCL